MRTAVRSLLTLLLAACIVSPLAAADTKAEKKAQRKSAKARPVRVVRVPKTVELTAEQKQQVAAINQELGPKFTELRGKLNAVLTDEQKKARAEAMKANRQAKLKGKEAKQAVQAAVNLTDEQKKQRSDVQAEMSALRKQANEKFLAILTPEQKARVKPARKAGAKKARPKKSGDKKPAKKTDAA